MKKLIIILALTANFPAAEGFAQCYNKNTSPCGANQTANYYDNGCIEIVCLDKTTCYGQANFGATGCSSFTQAGVCFRFQLQVIVGDNAVKTCGGTVTALADIPCIQTISTLSGVLCGAGG